MKSRNLNLFFIITLFVGILAISGCSKESKAPVSIVGTWTYKKNITILKTNANTTVDTTYYPTTKVITFFEDGYYKYYSFDSVDLGSYTIKNNKVDLESLIYLSSGDFTIITLTENRLQLQTSSIFIDPAGGTYISNSYLTR